MSQIQELNTLQAKLNYDSLVEKQRRLLKEMSSSSTISDISTSTTYSHFSEIGTAKKNQQDGQEKITNGVDIAPSLSLSSSSLVVEKEWISNWGFRRVPSTKKPQDFNSECPLPLPSNIAKTNNEGGVFYFERIKLNDNNNTVADAVDLSSVTPTRVSSSSSDIIGNNDVDTEQNIDNENFEEQNLGFCCFDMTNDDLFADLEAAADSNDDSELSFDDFMDMDLVDGDDIDIDNHNNYDDDERAHSYVHEYSTSLHDVDEFLNKSTSTSTANNIPVDDDDDIHMMSQDDDDDTHSNNNMHIYLSPIPNKASISSSLLYGSLQGYRNSPTCVAHPMACNMSSSSSPLLTNSFSMSSASTRPAFQEMRKMMTKLMDNGNMPRSRHQDLQLPCAEGMDEMYLDTLEKLSASMARSNRTRKSLSIPLHQTMQNNTNSNSPHGQEYNREYNRFNQILQSGQTSSRQVDTCLRSVRMMNRWDLYVALSA